MMNDVFWKTATSTGDRITCGGNGFEFEGMVAEFDDKMVILEIGPEGRWQQAIRREAINYVCYSRPTMEATKRYIREMVEEEECSQ